MNKQIILSAILFTLIATTVIASSPLILAKKSKGTGTGNGEFDSGYRAGVAKAAADVANFDKNGGVGANNPPPCPITDNKQLLQLLLNF